MLDVRLARLGLPLPLEPAIGRALMHRERATQHEGLVVAWELAIRILAGSLWAACRHANLSSTALETVAAKLDRPSMGHWVELARTCASLLRESNAPVAAAFRTTLDGLDAPLPAECGLRTFAARVAELPNAPPRPRRVQEALDQLPHYRNAAASTHQDIGPAFREASVEPLLAGLVDFCERVPLTGALSLILVGRLEKKGHGGTAEIARLHGTFPSWSQRAIPDSAWGPLVSTRPYLVGEPDLFVPLFPMAAVTNSGAEWHVGWYARQVHVPTVAYQGAGGQEFQIALAPDELESLVRGARSERDTASDAAALRLDPYRGLLAYEEEHAPLFFGREEETEAAVARIEERGALFVYGASGSGKSSWLRAGIVPALRARATLAGRTLLPIVLMPGDHPLASLRRALTLARGGSPDEAATWARTVDEAIPPRIDAAHERGVAHLLRGLAARGALPVLVIDQMEEAATLALDREESRAFLGLVAAAAAAAKDIGAVVLASARADLLAPLLEHESVRRFLEHAGTPIGSIPSERLARVIVEPLRGRGVPVEAGLAETIVADVANEPGSLALLSQVLTTLWSERARFGGAITKQGYVDAGRVAGALERQAEAALAELGASSVGASSVGASSAGASSAGASSAGASSAGASSAGASSAGASSAGASSVGASSVGAGSAEAGRRVDRLFRALATSDEGERFTRRRVKLDALASELATSADDVRATVAPFVARRLVVLDGAAGTETVEVAHERLLVAWPRLAHLLASEREVLELRSVIEVASSAWRASGGGRELWSDATSNLRRGEELLASGRLDLDERGRAFLVASRASVRRRKRVERSVLGALVLLAAAAGYGMWSARQAAEEARQATARESLLRQEANVREREAQLSALLPELENFETLDDDVYTYARSQPRPAYEWWIEDAEKLLNGVPADPASGRPRKPGLLDVPTELTKVRPHARPATAAEIESDRRSHPRWAEFERLRDELQWRRRMLGEAQFPSEPEVEAKLAKERLPTSASELNERAWKLVDVDPDAIQYGGEVRGLLLARRALAAAAAEERAAIRGTLAWALYRCGRFEDAESESRTAATEGSDDSKAEQIARHEHLVTEIGRWREPDSRAKEAELTARMASDLQQLDRIVSETRTWRFDDRVKAYWHTTLERLETGRVRLEAQLEIARATVLDEPARHAWAEAIAAVTSSEHYRGSAWPGGRLTPQLGLLPIGPDPDSGLWEFAHLATGRPAQRDPATRRIVLDPEMGLVLVLLPGGRVPVAANESDNQLVSLTEVDLDPFCASKYEMTVAQWTRIGGFQRGHREESAALDPATDLSWDDCQVALPRTGWLRLPSEAQWEYGCRAGSKTTWWPSDNAEDLRDAANIDFTPDDQSYGGRKPIGERRGNTFGLHDVHGNAWEWCQDGGDDGQRRSGDGLLDVPDAALRVSRGGRNWYGAAFAPSSSRSGGTPDYRFVDYGLRPARGITP